MEDPPDPADRDEATPQEAGWQRPLGYLAAGFAWTSLLLYDGFRRAPTTGPLRDYGLADGQPKLRFLLVLLGLLAVGTLLLAFFVREASLRGGPWRKMAVFLLVSSMAVPVTAILGDLGVPVAQAAWGTATGMGLLALIVAIVGLAGWLAVQHPERALATSVSILLVTAPFGVIVSAGAASDAWSYAAMEPVDAEEAGSLALDDASGEADRRVVVLVFDELDRVLAAQARQEGVELPSFASFTEEHVTASQAFSTGSETMITLPALLTGLQLEDVEPTGRWALELKQPEEPPVPHTDRATFLQKVEPEASSAVVGFYHPYCKLWDLDPCSWYPTFRETLDAPAPQLASKIVVDAVGVLPPAVTSNPLTETIRGTGDGPAVDEGSQASAIEAQRFLQERALPAASDPALDLVFVHHLAPHPASDAGFYDAINDTYATGSAWGYSDNLALTDRLLAETLDAIEDEGLGEDTAIVVTGDHGYREAEWGAPDIDGGERDEREEALSDQAVPLLVKAFEDDGPARVERPVDNVVIHDLVLALLEGDIDSDSEVAAFLEEQAPRPLGLASP